jgi:inner membrane protein involved in colicin E2 resistance
MSKQGKRVWRRTNTYGIYFIAIVVTTVLVFNLLELSRVCGAL